jgi:hypothetical protein
MIDEAGQGRMPAGLQQAVGSPRWAAGLLVLVAAQVLSAVHLRTETRPVDGRARTSSRTVGASTQRQVPARDNDKRDDDKDNKDKKDKIERTHREEGEAILALADAAMTTRPVPSDFAVTWQNDFVKAQRGTFVPFTLSVDISRLRKPAALVYVRAIRRDGAERKNQAGRDDSERRDGPTVNERESAVYPVDAIFPVELIGGEGTTARISRGFAVAPGEYDVFVVMRERVDPDASRSRVQASVLKQALTVPDFGSGELTTSSVIVADRLTVLSEAVPADQLAERPYAIGRNEITPSVDRRFGRDEELIVVLLVYNPMVTGERQFDLKVEYHFFRRVASGARAAEPVDGAEQPRPRGGERYFNHTDPQRFNPALMGNAFDPRSGEPVMAGQVVPLAGFEEGEYRLDVQVIDLLSGKSISRDVFFTVGS